jgi:hypothetical protein
MSRFEIVKNISDGSFNYMKSYKQSILAVAVVGLLMVPSVKASLTLNLSSATYVSGYSAPSSAGSLLYDCGINGNSGGTLQSSYNCSSGLKAVNYVGGTTALGTCFVLECSNGGAYVWNISNWNGTDQINCNFNTRYFNCKDIQVYGNCKPAPKVSSVPEPSTLLAGVLLLVPLGVQGFRRLRNRQSVV